MTSAFSPRTGAPFLPAATISFEMDMTEAGWNLLGRYDPPTRRAELTLAAGQCWPDTVKRGQTIEVGMFGYLLKGKVLYCRMSRLVMEGDFA